ncbi:MAG TPA: hypothetical protein PKY23_10615 [Bacillota bacterium]|nr:hypothetical protein [Bacillota bacterium]
MKRSALAMICAALLLIFGAVAAAAPQRQVTFSFTELWLDPGDIYEEEGVRYADGYLVVEAEHLPELTLSSLPLLGSGDSGSLLIESLSLSYLDAERLAELDPEGEYGFDESCVELAARLYLDRAAVESVLGLDPAALEEEWAAQSEEIIAYWIDAVYEAYYACGADLAYEDDLYLSPDDGGLVELELSAGDDGGAVIDLLAVSWGLEALAGRLFEQWTNVGYWFYDLSLAGEINAGESSLYLETAVSYLLYEYYYPYPDNYTCWIWEGYSLLPPVPEAVELLGLEEGYLDYAADYEGIPRAWRLREGEKVLFQIPENWHPKAWWEPYGPPQGADGGYDLSASGVSYRWEDNLLSFPGPLNMEKWAQHYSAIYWEEAGGLPNGLPYVELSPGPHYFAASKGLITGIVVFLFLLAAGGLIHGAVALARIPQRADL